MSKIAMCRRCYEEPLVSTFHFRAHEFICLKCGRLYAWFEPKAATETPKRLEKMAAREAEWLEHARPLLTGGAYHVGCAKCDERNGYHTTHATDEEWAKHKEAEQWLRVRTGKASNQERMPQDSGA